MINFVLCQIRLILFNTIWSLKISFKSILKILILKDINININLILKKDYSTGVFLWILQSFSEYLFYRTPPDNCFWHFIAIALFKKNLSDVSTIGCLVLFKKNLSDVSTIGCPVFFGNFPDKLLQLNIFN